jgi:3-hydroxymyristoyl/3-hydroxydecanoyl-(acyl carrier protein) dehydratase
VIGHPVIDHLVALNYFFRARLEGTHYSMALAFVYPLALNAKKSLIQPNVLPVQWIQIRFTHAQVMHRIQDVRFSRSVLPHNRVNFWAELKAQEVVVLKVDQVQICKVMHMQSYELIKIEGC